MIFDLVRDFADVLDAMPNMHASYRLLEIVNNAIRSNVHFIARHRLNYPQALFQTLWNDVFWHESPDAKLSADDDSVRETVTQKTTSRENRRTLARQWRDGKETATPGRIWLRANRKLQAKLVRNTWCSCPSRGIDVTALSASHDGHFLAVGYADGLVVIWEVGTLRKFAKLRMERRRTDQSMWSAVRSIRFSCTLNRIVASTDHAISVWNLGENQRLKKFRDEYGGAQAVSFSDDGHSVLALYDYGIIRVFDCITGERLMMNAAGRPHGNQPLGASWQNVDLEDALNACERKLLAYRYSWTRSDAPVDETRFVPNWDRRLYVWSVLTGDLVAEIDCHNPETWKSLDGIQREINCTDRDEIEIVESVGGRELRTRYSFGRVSVFDRSWNKLSEAIDVIWPAAPTCKQATSEVLKQRSFSLFVIAITGSDLVLWNAATRTRYGSVPFLPVEPQTISLKGIRKDHTLHASADSHQRVVIEEHESKNTSVSGDVTAEAKPPTIKRSPKQRTMTPDGVRLRTFLTSEACKFPRPRHWPEVAGFFEDEQSLATENGQFAVGVLHKSRFVAHVVFWDTNSGDVIHDEFASWTSLNSEHWVIEGVVVGIDGLVAAIRHNSRDHHRSYAVSLHGTSKTWKRRPRELNWLRLRTGAPTACALSRDGTLLAVAETFSGYASIHAYETSTMVESRELSIRGNRIGKITSVRFSQDGFRLAGQYGRQFAVLWSIADQRILLKCRGRVDLDAIAELKPIITSVTEVETLFITRKGRCVARYPDPLDDPTADLSLKRRSYIAGK